jgi:tRNA (cmo5U34)-methyltransferase
MSQFQDSHWADAQFAQEYLDHADHYIPDRYHLFNILQSFYRTFVARPGVRCCDLGCGDGVLTEQLLREDPAMACTLVDGSAEMLAAAQRRLKARDDLRFVQQGFDAVTREPSVLGTVDFIYSGFAIHHVDPAERRTLFAALAKQLSPGGWFLNIEACLPEHSRFTEWYYQLWQDWILRRGKLLGYGDKFREVPRQARENRDNQYRPVAEQLADLEAAGFRETECHYKNGIFTIYAGQKPAAA